MFIRKESMPIRIGQGLKGFMCMQDPSSANAIMTKPLLGFIHCLLAITHTPLITPPRLEE